MGYHRAAFAAGVAVGFIVGSRAGRERYDQIVKYTRKAYQSPAVQKATQVTQAKARDLSKLAAARATELSKSAAQQAPKTAGSIARKAKEQAGKISVPAPRRWRIMHPMHPAHPESTAATTNVSANGNGRNARARE